MSESEDQNARLRAALKKCELDKLEAAKVLNRMLKSDAARARSTEIRRKVMMLKASGHVSQRQLDAGLVEALTLIPKGSFVEGVSAVDVVLECLKAGGVFLMDAPLVGFSSADRRITGLDVAKRAAELREEGKGPEEAYLEAHRENRRKFSG